MPVWEIRLEDRRTHYLRVRAETKEEAEALLEEFLGEECEVLEDLVPDHTDVDFGRLREYQPLPGYEKEPDIFPGWKDK